MKTQLCLFLMLMLIVVQTNALELEVSEKLPFTAQLQKEVLPWFVARDRSDKEPFSKKHLEGIITPQTKRVALVFFATWCVPCREGIAILRDRQDELDKNGIMIVLVNAAEKDVPKIESWIKANGDDKWPVILDKFSNLQKNTGLIANSESEMVFPKTILLDNKLKPLLLIGAEGKDWPQVLWE